MTDPIFDRAVTAARANPLAHAANHDAYAVLVAMTTNDHAGLYDYYTTLNAQARLQLTVALAANWRALIEQCEHEADAPPGTILAVLANQLAAVDQALNSQGAP